MTFDDKTAFLTFDLVFRGQNMVPRVNNYPMSSFFVILCILTPR